MAKTIASLIDGRVCPWYLEGDPIPEKFVLIPDDLLAKYASGEVADGKTLARMALMRDGSEVGTAHQNVATPPPPDKAKVGGDPDPGAVDPATVERGEPTSPEVTHFPTQGRTIRV